VPKSSGISPKVVVLPRNFAAPSAMPTPAKENIDAANVKASALNTVDFILIATLEI
jgi:hypothetical protein